jgi:hypothetical protein
MTDGRASRLTDRQAHTGVSAQKEAGPWQSRHSGLLGYAAVLAAEGERVLVVDLDAQAKDAATTLGVEPGGDRLDIFDVLYAGGAGHSRSGDRRDGPGRACGRFLGSKQLSRIDSETMMTPEFRLVTAAPDGPRRGRPHPRRPAAQLGQAESVIQWGLGGLAVEFEVGDGFDDCWQFL